MKYIAILGSTGSIGTQTLEVVRAQQDIKVTALSAGEISICWSSRFVNSGRLSQR